MQATQEMILRYHSGLTSREKALEREDVILELPAHSVLNSIREMPMSETKFDQNKAVYDAVRYLTGIEGARTVLKEVTTKLQATTEKKKEKTLTLWQKMRIGIKSLLEGIKGKDEVERFMEHVNMAMEDANQGKQVLNNAKLRATQEKKRATLTDEEIAIIEARDQEKARELEEKLAATRLKMSATTASRSGAQVLGTTARFEDRPLGTTHITGGALSSRLASVRTNQEMPPIDLTNLREQPTQLPVQDEDSTLQ